jgi:hypothetical protein
VVHALLARSGEPVSGEAGPKGGIGAAVSISLAWQRGSSLVDFSRDGLTASGQERMYHSSAILLADGSVMVAGSNPNKDVTFGQWGTSYEIEKFYPAWYNKPRPDVSGSLGV